MVMMLVQIQPGLSSKRKKVVKMILDYSSHIRIFSSNGRSSERVLLLKFFNNYSIFQLCDMIKNLKAKIEPRLNLNITIDFFKYFKKFFKKLLAQIALLSGNLTKKPDGFFNKIFAKSMKVFFINYILKWHKITITELFFLKPKKSFFFQKNLFSKNFVSKLVDSGSHYGKSEVNFLNNDYLPKNFKDTRGYILKKDAYSRYKKTLSSSYHRYLDDLNNRSVFVMGPGLDFYRGTISPFYNSKFNWFVSTGLKSDIECSDLEVSDQLFSKQDSCSFYESALKDLIFKVRNFKNIVTTQIKQKVRHVIFYKANTFLGTQRFISESRSSFTFKQNNFYLLSNTFFLTHTNSELALNYFFNRIHNNSKIFIIPKIKLQFLFFSSAWSKKNFFSKMYINFKKNYSLTFSFQRSKIYFLLFQFSKYLLNFRSFLENEIRYIMRSEAFIYKGFLSFFQIVQHSDAIFVKLLGLFAFNNLVNYYKRGLSYSNDLMHKNLKNIFHAFYLNRNFHKKILNEISKASYFDLFFEIFLAKKKRQGVVSQIEDLTLDLEYRTSLSMRLFVKGLWYNTYKKFFFYMYFFLDWKLNFDFLVLPKKNQDLSYSNFRHEFLEPFKLLQVKWNLDRFVSLPELYFFFLIL